MDSIENAIISENGLAPFQRIWHKVQQQRDEALVSKRMWETSCDALLIKRDEAIKHRDAALKERDEAFKDRDTAIEQRIEMSKELASLRKRKREEEGK